MCFVRFEKANAVSRRHVRASHPIGVVRNVYIPRVMSTGKANMILGLGGLDKIFK